MNVTMSRTTLPSLSHETLTRFIEKIDARSDAQMYVSVPAGPNRDMMAAPIARLTTAAADEFPKMSFTVRIAVDDVELQKCGLTPSELTMLPSYSRAKKLFDHERVSVEAHEQVESNSVWEVVEAMRDAATSRSFSHLLVPRDSHFLINRLSLGVEHYAAKIESDSLRSADVIQIPGEPQQNSARRTALEAASYIATRLAYCAGETVFESYIEKRGLFSGLLNRIHEMKVRVFDRPGQRI